MAHFVWDRGDGAYVPVALHTATAPSEEEWTTWMRTLERVADQVHGELALSPNLVLTDGGGPSQAQRTATNNLLARGRSLPAVAIVTDSRIVRTLVRGLSIFNPRLRVFEPADIGLACTHIGLERALQRDILRRAAETVAAEIGVDAVRTLKALPR
jgi:hypothetical protein